MLEAGTHSLSQIQLEPDLSTRDCSVEWDFSEHAYPINCLAWSTDDTILLTGAEQQIKMWDMKVSYALRTIT
jgi:WD40 repeat protein